MTPEELMAMAEQQWLDPQILQMAADSIWATPGWGMPWVQMTEQDLVAMSAQPPQEQIPWNPADVYNNAPLVIHADEMAPMLQQASQDEVMAFVRKILDLYLWIQ